MTFLSHESHCFESDCLESRPEWLNVSRKNQANFTFAFSMSKYFLPDNQVGIHPDLIIASLQKLLLIYIFNIWMGLLQDSNNTA